MRDVTVICNFQVGLQTTIRGARFGFRRRLTPNSLFTSKLPQKVWVGGRQNWLCPREREALGTPLQRRCVVAQLATSRSRRVSEFYFVEDFDTD